MGRIELITEQIQTLIEEGIKLQPGAAEDRSLVELRVDYESWYTRALAVVSQVIPERLEDFQHAYRLQKRKDITYATYTISDYLADIVVKWAGTPVFDVKHAYSMQLVLQVSILKAALDAAPSALRDIRTVLQAELMDDDIEAAKELARSRHLRSAGVICGVVLESHLKSVAARHNVKFRKKRPTISDYNDALRDRAYDTPLWRLVHRLCDIRNLCAHAGDRDPSRDEVNDLIVGVEKIIKEVW